ncbi:MAG TPA: hypothetical protein VGV87_06955 [Blastocatellia bacterium]|jgi:hypothetical protein|nr:hypothetical protein [Blastocatellia bacterium]
MSRRPNQLKSIPITITTTGAIKDYLDALVATGFYGKSYTEAAERLLAQSLETLVKEGRLKRRSR